MLTRFDVNKLTSFEQCSNVILGKAYSIASRPKMVAVNHYEHPKNIPKND